MSAQTPPEKNFLRDQVQEADQTNLVNLEFETLLDYLKHNRGCDLTGYKYSSLMRRFQYRMQSINVDTYQSYLKYLQHHPSEYLALLDDVLINVTSFFRDGDAWDYLAAEVIPKLIANKQPNEPIRVWSAGCAAGQEIYSLLILLAEELGVEACLQQVQGFATDADEAALWQARQATYSDKEMMGMPPEWLEKYFELTEQGYVFHSGLRRTVIFARHDLSQDAPLSKIDLLLCRNVLIYFNLETQAAVLVRFHFALKNTGFLVLGKSEAIVNRRQIFTPFHLKHRVYTKGLKLALEDHLSVNPKFHKTSVAESSTPQHHFQQTAFETSPVAQVSIGLDGYLVDANEQANLLFGLTLDDWNSPFQELEPGKLIAAHNRALLPYCSRRPVLLQDVEWNTLQGTQYFDIAIAPVLDAKRQLLGSTLTFIDKTNDKRMARDLKAANAELERMAEALQVTEMELEAAQQELHLLEQDLHQ